MLDTDHLSLVQRGNQLVVQQLIKFNPQDIAITIVTVNEQLQGRIKIINRANSSDELVLAYTRLTETLKDLNNFNVLEFGGNAGNIYAGLIRQQIRPRVGTQDLRIAAITLSVDGILVTRNRRDFEKVPNLRLEDWTIT